MVVLGVQMGLLQMGGSFPNLIRLTHGAADSEQVSKNGLDRHRVSASPHVLSCPVKIPSVLLGNGSAEEWKGQATGQGLPTSTADYNISVSAALLGAHRRVFKSVLKEQVL